MIMVNEIIDKDKLEEIAECYFGHMVKAVVDVKEQLLAIDAELHSDLEGLLL